MKNLSCRHFNGEPGESIQNGRNRNMAFCQVSYQFFLFLLLRFFRPSMPSTGVHFAHCAYKNSNLSPYNHHFHRTVIWQYYQRKYIFVRPRTCLFEFQRKLIIILGAIKAAIGLEEIQGSRETRLISFKWSSERRSSYVRAVVRLFILATSFGISDPYRSDQRRDSSNSSDPCPPIGRGQTRPVNPLVPAQSEGRAEHDCTEFVVPGLKPRSDLGNHRSSAKFSRNRSMTGRAGAEHARNDSTIYR